MNKFQYNQKLSVEIIAEGITLIRENANELLQEAEILFNNQKYSRAFYLAVLSIEEISKVNIIRFVLLEDDQKAISKLWQDFRNHFTIVRLTSDFPFFLS